MAVTIRKSVESDLPALLDIYNHEVEHGVATFDLKSGRCGFTSITRRIIR